MSVTMALSSPKSTFMREDFPALGLPRITVLIPSVITLPSSADWISLSVSSLSGLTTASSLSPYPSREMCSGSSRADSMKAIS